MEINNREEKVAAVDEKIETDLELIGSTAIEDKLQDEVADTIQFMKNAGIKVWVLTGDKVGTAINIGHSAGLLDSSIDQYKLQEKGIDAIKVTIDRIQKKIIEATNVGERKQALIVAGATLITITNDPNLKKQFVDMAEKCDVVLACRVSPK